MQGRLAVASRPLVDEEEESSVLLDDDEDVELSWISWFSQLQSNRFLVVVDEDYIRDEFNLTGLNTQVPNYYRAIDIVLDSDVDEADDHSSSAEGDGRRCQLQRPPGYEPRKDGGCSEAEQILELSASILYGLVHARFILTQQGAQLMVAKYSRRQFGVCPNYGCNQQAVLPLGLSDRVGEKHAKVYCPKCKEVYHPSQPQLAAMDGAYFGSSFALLFFMQFPDMLPPVESGLNYYQPKLYGFRVSAKTRDMAADRLRDSGVAKPATPTWLQMGASPRRTVALPLASFDSSSQPSSVADAPRPEDPETNEARDAAKEDYRSF